MLGVMDRFDGAPTEDPRPDGLRRADSLVVVNTGNGKGKSSAAFGMMLRGIARGWKVAVVQFGIDEVLDLAESTESPLEDP